MTVEQILLRESGSDFVEIVKRILERYPPHAAKAGVCAHFMRVALMKPQRAQPQTTPRKRGSHAIQDAETVEERRQLIRHHADNVVMGARCKLCQPRTQTGRLLLSKLQNRCVRPVRTVFADSSSHVC